jgi:hypothetical protein
LVFVLGFSVKLWFVFNFIFQFQFMIFFFQFGPYFFEFFWIPFLK